MTQPQDKTTHGEMMGGGIGMGSVGIGMGGGMMRRAMRRGFVGPVTLRVIFSLMDADGDGTISLQEWQTAQERIFKAMDTNKDGTVTLEEMQNFVRGTPPSQQ
jgi:hypothetical protein